MRNGRRTSLDASRDEAGAIGGKADRAHRSITPGSLGVGAVSIIWVTMQPGRTSSCVQIFSDKSHCFILPAWSHEINSP